MDRQYTESFAIPTGGWTGGAQAIHNPSSTAGTTCNVRLWRDDSTTAPRTIAIAAGQILPLKVKFVATTNPLIGFN